MEPGVVDVLAGWWGALGPHAEAACVCDVKYGGEHCAKTEGWQQSSPGKQQCLLAWGREKCPF